MLPRTPGQPAIGALAAEQTNSGSSVRISLTTSITTVAAAALVAAGQAAGANSIVSVDFGNPTAEIATTVRVRTIADTEPTGLYLAVRATGGPPCAPDPFTDPASDRIFGGRSPGSGRDVAVGDTAASLVYTFPTAGTFQYCGWLRHDDIVATTTGQFTVASPVGAITGVLAPNPAPVGRNFLVTISGQSAVERSLYVALRSATGPACGASPSLEPSDSTARDQGDVLGSFSKQITLEEDAAGRYRLCSWVVTSFNDTSPLGVNETIIQVGPPPAKATRIKAGWAGITGTARARLGGVKRLNAFVSSALGQPTGRCAFDRSGRRWIQVAVVRFRAGQVCRVNVRLPRPGLVTFRVRYLPDSGWASTQTFSPRVVVAP